MSALRRLATTNLSKVSTIAQNAIRANVKPAFVARNFSTVLEKKEHADEARFIRDQEAKRQKEIRANLEKILALEDGHEDKQELIQILDKKEEKKEGLIAKYGLNDWKFAVPIGLMIAIPAISKEFIIIDAEFQLASCFFLFVSTLYTQVGGMIGKSLDEYAQEQYNEIKAIDTAIYDQLQAAISADELALSLEEDFKQFCELNDQIAIVQAEVLNKTEEHKYRDAIVKKLDSLYALEDAAVSAIRTRMVKSVKTNVVNTFKNDKKAKENALNQAIAVLSAGANAKLGKDIVGEAFAASLKSYRDDYAKQPAGADEILVQLEKDMKAVAAAPTVEGKGGNVFEL